MESALDVDPRRAVPIEVAFVDGQRDPRNFNLADQQRHSGLLGGCWVTEELTIFDQAS
jgi:hypothetical protein